MDSVDKPSAMPLTGLSSKNIPRLSLDEGVLASARSTFSAHTAQRGTPPLARGSLSSRSCASTAATSTRPRSSSSAGGGRGSRSSACEFKSLADRAGFLAAVREPREFRRVDVLILGGSLEGRLCTADVADRGETVILVEPSDIGRRAAFEAALKGSVLPAASVGRIGWEQVCEACDLQEERLRQLSAHLLQQRHVSLLVGDARFLQPELGEKHLLGAVAVAVDNGNGHIVHIVARRVQIALGVPAVEPQLREGMTCCKLPEHLPELATGAARAGRALSRVAVFGDGGRAAEICALCEAAGTKAIWLLDGLVPNLEVAGELGEAVVAAMRLRGAEVVPEFPVWRVHQEQDGMFSVLASNGSAPIIGLDAVVYAADVHQLVPPTVPKGTHWLMQIDGRQGYVFIDPNRPKDDVNDGHKRSVPNSARLSLSSARSSRSCGEEPRGRASVEHACNGHSVRTVAPSECYLGTVTSETEHHGFFYPGSALPLMPPPIRVDMIWSRPPLGTAGFSTAEAKQAYGVEPQVVFSRHRVCGGPELTVSLLFVGDGPEARCVGASVLGSGAAAMLLGMSGAMQAGATRNAIDAVLAVFPSTRMLDAGA